MADTIFKAYSHLFDSIPQGVFVFNTQGKIKFANSAVEKIFGISKEDLFKNDPSFLFDKAIESDGRPISLNNLPCFLALHYGIQTKDRLIGIWNRVQNRRRWILFNSVPVAGEISGKSSIVFCFLSDITEWEETKAKLVESEARFRQVIERCPIGIHTYSLNANNDLIFDGGNSAADAALGVRHDLLVGKPILEAFPGLAGTGLVEAYLDICLNGGIKHWENLEYQDDNICGIFDVYAFQTSPRRLAVFFFDITEKKNTEKALIESQERLRQAQKMETVGLLAGGIAHDFNNLLLPILGYSELIKKSLPSENPINEYVDQIVRAADRAKELINQLLAFSRKQVLRAKPLDLNKILNDLYKMLRRVIRENISLELCLAPRLPMFMGDPSMIEQVIINLVVNAQEATPQSGTIVLETGTITIGKDFYKTHPELAEGEYIVFSVSDTGIGMNAEVRSHIFEPFFTTKDKDGVGLGLAVAYGIIKQHQGAINVYSEVGRGTTFKIYLPVCQTLDEIEPTITTSQELARGSETILLAEDNELVRTITTMILEDLGYQVFAYSCAEELLQKIGTGEIKPDLLLTDLVLPEMNGKELFTKLQTFFPKLKVLYMSGYTDNIIVHHGILDKNICFIQKPFSIQDLSLKIREALKSY